MRKCLKILLITLFLLAISQTGNASLLHQWIFDNAHLKDGQFPDQSGTLHGKLKGESKFYQDANIEYLELDGMTDVVQVSDDISKLNLPMKAITVEAVVRFREFGDWLAAIGAFQDNGDFERGWLLGLNNNRFYFALASENKKSLSTIYSPTAAVPGKWYHIAGTYNGTTLKLYVNGQLASSTTEQSGNILYPPKAWMTIGAYQDDNENNLMTGSVRQVSLYDQELTATEILAQYQANQVLTDLPPKPEVPSDFLVNPYIQFATQTTIRILWETRSKSTSRVEYGEEVPLKKSIAPEGQRTMHEVELNGLKPETNYFYRVISMNQNSLKSASKIYSFQTAVKESTAYAFGVISDTQNNPKVWGQIAGLLFGERPNFAVLAGDIVGNGKLKAEWTDEFLGPGNVLMSRVPVYAIIGNHDADAKNYYTYLAAPEPEYYYTFTYGNAQFFMIDTDRKVSPGSEQHTWLEKALQASKAQWKFAVHHHPPYSSDENDYGDTWKGQSDRGDKDLIPLIALYEKYNLDICFFGHIHDYERTWPVRNNAVNRENGVIYIQTGGGGGSLENYAPTRSWFTAKLHRDHNFLIIAIHGNELQLQAIDWNGALFDVLQFNKK